jgi:hypothetical protein
MKTFLKISPIESQFESGTTEARFCVSPLSGLLIKNYDTQKRTTTYRRTKTRN